MTTAYTSLLGLALPVTGELSGTWGDTVNTAITSLLDTAIAGTTSITTDADITLSTTTGASNQARQAIILWNPASGTTTRNITAPAQSKIYMVINASGGTQSIVIRGAGPTTGVTIVKGESATVAWNGSDFIKVSSSGGGLTLTDLTVTGNTTLGDAAADTLTVNATSTFASPVSFQGLVNLPSTGRSAAAALTPTNPAFLYGVASTYTDTTSSGTIAAMAPFYSIAQPTLSTSNVTTYTNASTLYIANAPAAAGSATITNPYALYVASGASYFGGTVTAGTVNLTTLDATNVEVTNIKAKDGTAAMTIADSTGVVTVNNLTDSSLTAGRVTFAGTAGNLTDSANLTWNGSTFSVIGQATIGNRLTLNGVGTSELYTADASGLYLTAATSAGMYIASDGAFYFRKATTPFTNYMTLTSTGLAITGTLTNTSTYTQTATEATIRLSTTGQKTYDLISGGGGNLANGYFAIRNNTNGNNPFYIDPAAPANCVYISSTGLAVTGAISATGNISVQDNLSVVLGTSGGAVSISHLTPGVPRIAFTAGGSEKMALTDGGFLGIGTNSPSAFLDIGPTTGASQVAAILRGGSGLGNTGGLGLYTNDVSATARNWGLVSNSSAYGDFSIRQGTSVGANPLSAGLDRFYISNGGNVGIGTSSPTSISGYTVLEVNGNTSGSILDMAQGDAMKGRFVAVSAGFTIETSAGVPLNFAPTGTNRMTISTAGYVTTTNQPMFMATGNTAGWWTPGSDAIFYIPTNSTGAADQTVSGSNAGFAMTASGSARFNTGSHYNPATGIFTAPIAGRYFFFASGLWRRNTSTASEYGSIASFINGTLYYYGADQAPYQFSGVAGAEWFYKLSFFVDLAASDGVSVRFARNGTIQVYADRFIFGGYLVG